MKSILTVLVFLFTFHAAAEPRRYIVEFAAGLRPAGAFEELRGEQRFRVRREFSRVLNGAAIELAEGTSIDEIARLPHVVRVTPDVVVTAYGRAAAAESFGALAPHAAASDA